jgi:hypothetical protein
MKLAMQLARTEAVALLALSVAAGLVAGYGAYDSAVNPGMVSASGAAQLGFLGTIVFGIFPVVFLGAPIYVWLSRRGWATWATAAGLGLWPGLGLAFLSLELGLFGGVCGLVVSGITHAICRRWVGPNNSFKPKPLRGSA